METVHWHRSWLQLIVCPTSVRLTAPTTAEELPSDPVCWSTSAPAVLDPGTVLAGPPVALPVDGTLEALSRVTVVGFVFSFGVREAVLH